MMLRPNVGPSVGLFLVTVLTALTAVSCGSSSSKFGSVSLDASTFEGGQSLLGAIGDAAGALCVAKTCAESGYNCGENTDGCGNLIACGTCSAPAFCGGGGYSRCGTNASAGQDAGGAFEAGAPCVPATCANLGFDCGYAGDGCGGSLNCGGASACSPPAFCGGGGPQKCGGGDVGASADGAVSSGCVSTTCSDLGFDCGYAGDGCGNELDCGGVVACSSPAYCGGGGPNKCGGSVFGTPDGGPAQVCTPTSCSALGYDCGYAGDGCGSELDCGGPSACASPEYCGGGGPNVCGGSVYVSADGGAVKPCVPTTCAALGYSCGYGGDGCGGELDCGGPSACASPEYCGGGGPNRCGGSVFVSADGGAVNLCTPMTCAALGYDCGGAGDGCGDLLNCGSCSGAQYCGGGGPNRCGGNVYVAADGGAVNLCTPTTCSKLGYTCGPAGDGCGNLLDCGTCTGTQYCGGGGPNQCGGNVYVAPDGGAVNLCTPETCMELGYDCGPAADGCGNLVQCGTCSGANTCGGGGTPGVCGHTCGGLCQYQASCTGGTPTTITGRVLAGQSAWTGLTPDPVPNVLVYVPNGTVQPISQGYTTGSCPQCGADVSGSPLVSTYTNYDGTFTLTDVPSPPAGQTVPLVIQLGRWRRQFQIAPPSACAATSIGDLNLPRNHTEGSIPLTAISTGAVDALECVLLKMGVDESEFTSSTAAPSGRIHIYAKGPGSQLSNGVGPGAYIADPASMTNPKAALSQPESALMASAGSYMKYDQILLPCWGSPLDFNPSDTNNMRSTDEPGDLVTYANSGGHFFATHFSYSWLVGNGEFNGVANWNPNENNPGTVTWTLNVSKVPPVVPAPMHSGIFWQWLNLVSALSNANPGTPPTNPQVAITDPRHDVDGVTNGSVDWIDGTDPQKKNAMVEHFTFNTPVGQTNQCGHAIFSDFHVSGVTNANSIAFPGECTTSFTSQERILEYMLFDLASCVSPPQSSCPPMSCASQNIGCGPAGDGCGNQLECGTCTAPLTCGGAGVNGQCGKPDGGACTPRTCSEQGLACGPAGDGCGGEMQCGTCTSPQTCGGGGVTGQCGEPDGGSCTPRSCALQGFSCGPAGDGCGNVIACGSCPAGETCGGGGVAGQCGAPDGGACAPRSCAVQNISCGPAGDGCGNAIQCGSCPAGETCGGGGVAGQCGAPDGGACAPRSCAVQNISCGPAGDGCGNAIQCGSCPAGEACGGGGVGGQCGAPDGGACKPLTCAVQNISCGPAGDGCGNAIECGACQAPLTCGGGGLSGQCGEPEGGYCVPQTCAQEQIGCGPAGDGCGNLLQCGECTAPQTCGGGGTYGQCGGGACMPLTCAQLGYGCGPAGDGCGGVLDCGSCSTGQTCGGGGTPGQCGSTLVPR
ncbi:MAG: hypothetical protein ABSC94_19905 [Polyangiaceae bacterium]